MKYLSFILFVVLFNTVLIAEETENPDIEKRYEVYHLKYDINENLSHEETHKIAVKILKEDAVRSEKEKYIRYSNSLQKLEILEAYTKKTDGKIIKVPETNFQNRSNTGEASNTPIYSDYNTTTILFPEVEVGDTVFLSYKIVQSEPMFPGQFSVSSTFPKLYAYDDIEIEFNYPESLDADYTVREMSKNLKGKNNRKKLLLSFKNSNPVKNLRQNYSVWDPEQEPGYIFTTFESYKELAEAYGKRAIPKAKVTKQIQELADKITGNEQDVNRQVKLLYEWVAKNITFKGNCLGVGAVVPRDLNVVIENKIGDC